MDLSVIIDPLVNDGLDAVDKRREKNNSAYDRQNALDERRRSVNQFHSRACRRCETRNIAAGLWESAERNFSTGASMQRLHLSSERPGEKFRLTIRGDLVPVT